MKASQSIFVPVRGLKYHVRSWGSEDAPKLFLLHGWMDCSASFQFTIDALKNDWHVLAPDWRGYGLTQWAGTDTYWFPEFIADLEHLLDHFQPDTPVNLVAHSFGAAVACVYAGVRPQRIARLFNIDGFGARDFQPEGAPARWAHLLKLAREGKRFGHYASFAALEQRLHRQFPKVPAQRIAWLARHLAREDANGGIAMLSDPSHASNYGPHFSNRLDDSMACWRAITAPVLWLVASDGSPVKRTADLSDGRLQARLACYRTRKEIWLDDTGHMVHLERPEELARLIEEFFPAGLQDAGSAA
jgi:pimeloyl-ACP methyl ester carboxylesterase